LCYFLSPGLGLLVCFFNNKKKGLYFWQKMNKPQAEENAKSLLYSIGAAQTNLSGVGHRSILII